MRRIALCVPILLLLAAPLMADEVLFEEDFESVTLGPNVDEGVAKPKAWSPDGPTGWVVEFDLQNEDGVTEWKGWTFADAGWWTQAAGDQDRSKFTDPGREGLATGIVAVADPDEYDDKNGAAGPGYFTWLFTPPIPVNLAGEDSITIAFDSSWRPEDTQNARLYATFDGEAKEFDVLTLVSLGGGTEFIAPNDGIDDVFADQVNVNERLELTIPNPRGAKEMTIVWEMTDATNDWWWAIDHIEVSTSDPLAVDPAGKAAAQWGAIKRSR
ncbi:MAG: hypothetical protein ABGY41_16705 [Candidatus Poribacteria bacterium]